MPKSKPRSVVVSGGQDPGPDYALEALLRRRHGGPVAGIDEAGRGPLAGPVVAAAVILDKRAIPDGLDDSKKLTAERREALFEELCGTAEIAVAVVSALRIDRINILQASLAAMREALAALSTRPACALVDGRDVPAGLLCHGEAVIGGDGRSLSVAAASVVAKVTRDRMMRAHAAHYPGYGFESHVGYGTPAHLEALARLGPCPLHRRSFAPVAAVMAGHVAPV